MDGVEFKVAVESQREKAIVLLLEIGSSVIYGCGIPRLLNR